MQRRLWDLLCVVRSHVHRSRFARSYGLKSVLPALVPEMSTKARLSQSGATHDWLGNSSYEAAWIRVERDGIEKALLPYCRATHAGASEAARQTLRSVNRPSSLTQNVDRHISQR
jgi:hypothetical protein